MSDGVPHRSRGRLETREKTACRVLVTVSIRDHSVTKDGLSESRRASVWDFSQVRGPFLAPPVGLEPTTLRCPTRIYNQPCLTVCCHAQTFACLRG